MFVEFSSTGPLPDALAPVGVTSATNIRLIRARVGPVCTRTAAANFSAFSNGTMQDLNADPTQTCFLCGPGSHRVLVNGVTRCRLCPAGTAVSRLGLLFSFAPF